MNQPAGPNRPRTSRVNLEELFLRHGVIDEAQLKKAREEQKKWGGEIGRVLVDLGFISEQMLMQGLAHGLGIPFIDPFTENLDDEIVKLLGVQLCERYGVIAVRGQPEKKMIIIATADPTNEVDFRTIEQISKFKVRPAAATIDSINKAIRKYFYGEAGGAPAPAPEAAAPAAPAAPVAPAAPEPAKSYRELEILSDRLYRLEKAVQPIEGQLNQLLTHPHMAALIARLERVEQTMMTENAFMKALIEILLERNVFTKEDLVARARKHS